MRFLLSSGCNMEIGFIEDKILKAINHFVAKSGTCQHSITLPFWYYYWLLKKANSTDLGRNFASNGLYFCQLPVLCGGWRIVINPEPPQCDIYKQLCGLSD